MLPRRFPGIGCSPPPASAECIPPTAKTPVARPPIFGHLRLSLRAAWAATAQDGKNIGSKKMKPYFLFFAPIFLPLILPRHPEKFFARRKETKK
jgi:hypothetical protein